MSTSYQFKFFKDIEDFDITIPESVSGIIFQYTNTIYYMQGHQNNGDYITISPNANGAMSYYNSSRVLVWSKTPGAIASHIVIFVPYFSSVDDIYYIITYNSGTIILSSLNKTDGSVTNLSVAESIPSYGLGFSYHGMKQLSNGNLVYFGSPSSLSGFRKRIEFTNTGTVVSNDNMIQNGIDLFSAVQGNNIRFTYQTDDLTIFAGIISNNLFVARGGAFRSIYLSHNHIFNGALLTGWNGYITVVSPTNSSVQNSPRFFVKTDFDRFLSDICDSVGI